MRRRYGLRQRSLTQLPDSTRHATSHPKQSNPKEDQTVRPGRIPKTEYHRADILPSQRLEACRHEIRQAHDKLRRNVLHRSDRYMVDQLSLEPNVSAVKLRHARAVPSI